MSNVRFQVSSILGDILAGIDSSFDSQVIFRFSLCFTLVWMVKWAANISLIVGISNSCLLTLDTVTHVHHLSKVSQVPRGNWPG